MGPLSFPASLRARGPSANACALSLRTSFQRSLLARWSEAPLHVASWRSTLEQSSQHVGAEPSTLRRSLPARWSETPTLRRHPGRLRRNVLGSAPTCWELCSNVL